MTLLSGLVAYYKFDGNAQDSVRMNHGIVSGAQLVAGKIGSAYNFSGSYSVSVPNSIDINLSSDLSISAWVNLGSNPGWERIVAKPYTSSNFPYTMYGLVMAGGGHPTEIKGQIRLELAQNGRQHVIHTTTVVPSGQWVHIVGTYDSAVGPKLYYNSNWETSGQGIWESNPVPQYVTLTGSLDVSNTRLFIGWDGYEFGNHLKGVVDEIAIYNRVLSDDEILTLYNSGAGYNIYPYEDSTTILGGVAVKSS